MALVTQESAEQVDRPDENWKYPYAASALDFGSNLQLSVSKVSDSAVGYRIAPALQINNSSKAPLGFLDEFCQNHGVTPKLRETRSSYRLEINRRDDLQHLRLVYPYVIGRRESAEIIAEKIIPDLKEGQASSKQGFVDLMFYVDKVRENTQQRREPKYDQQYFKDEWDM